MSLQSEYETIIDLIQKSSSESLLIGNAKVDSGTVQYHQSIQEKVKKKIASLEESIQQRLSKELFGLGPLEELMQRKGIEEIFLTESNTIFYFEKGQIKRWSEEFLGSHSNERIIDKILNLAKINLTIETPFADGNFRDFRVHAVGKPLAKCKQVTLRKLNSGQLIDFQSLPGFKNSTDLLIELVQKKSNILIVGPTGSGKTSLLNWLISKVQSNERVAVLEETSEILLPNSTSYKLLTRISNSSRMESFELRELVRQSLRMRPQRIILGEMRDSEAKDFLLALSTGHQGCMATMHANSAREALIRLEMLIQLGAPKWATASISKLISLALDFIIVIENHPSTGRYIKEIAKVDGIDNGGVLIHSTKPSLERSKIKGGPSSAPFPFHSPAGSLPSTDRYI